MSSTHDSQASSPPACGCCSGRLSDIPVAIDNRPGLTEVAYRAGTHAQFFDSLLAGLAGSSAPALRRLRTRRSADPTIAFLDLVAGVADTLTFYSERIANEAFLRTAVEERSVFELSRALGFQPPAGLSATVFLAFTLEGGRGAPGVAQLPHRCRVQSLPGPGETPQVFETEVEFAARSAWNELRPRPTRPQTLSPTQPVLLLKGTTTNLKSGDVLVIAPDPDQALARRVHSVTIDREHNRTRIDFSSVAQPLPAYRPPSLRSRPPDTLPAPATAAAWNALFGSADAISHADAQAILQDSGWDPDDLVAYFRSSPAPASQEPLQGVFVLRQRAGFFGHNAPRQEMLAAAVAGDLPAPLGASWDADATRAGSTIWENSQRALHSGRSDVYLDRVIPDLVPETWAALESPDHPDLLPLRITRVTEESIADFAISGRATGLNLTTRDRLTLWDGSKRRAPLSAFLNRTATAWIQSERLTLADLPIDDDLASGTSELSLEGLDFNLFIGQHLMLTGSRTDRAEVQGSELIAITGLRHGDRVTTLTFVPGLSGSYRRSTVRLNANVVPATHGETTREILGHGNAAIPHQAFTLSRAPLTFTLSPGASRPVAALEVWVNDVLWREVPSLHVAGPMDTVYTLRRLDDGMTRVEFGDGLRGARLPTGRDNVRVVYRVGTGLSGLLRAGQISLLVSQPLGVKSVTNPLPPSGAQDPATPADIRTQAPRSVLTLDRVVSLQDFEDFARQFPGIQKAHAAWVWDGSSRSVLLTVLGPAGVEVPPASPVATALVTALRRHGPPRMPIRIASRKPSLFTVAATVWIKPDRDPRALRRAVLAALRHQYALDARDFGVGVAVSEIIAVIHEVDGVEAVDLNRVETRRLAASGPVLTVHSDGFIPAHLPGFGSADRGVAPAEILAWDETQSSNLNVEVS